MENLNDWSELSRSLEQLEAELGINQETTLPPEEQPHKSLKQARAEILQTELGDGFETYIKTVPPQILALQKSCPRLINWLILMTGGWYDLKFNSIVNELDALLEHEERRLSAATPTDEVASSLLTQEIINSRLVFLLNYQNTEKKAKQFVEIAKDFTQNCKILIEDFGAQLEPELRAFFQEFPTIEDFVATLFSIGDTPKGLISPELLKPNPSIPEIASTTQKEVQFNIAETSKINVSEFINSPEFLKSGVSVKFALEYLTLHPDGFEFWEFAKQLDPAEKNHFELLYNSIAKRLNITDPETPENRRLMLEYFYENFYLNGYYYHAFNGCFADAISKKGLSTSERLWEWDELKEIIAIGEKTGNQMLLGWVNLNCEGKTSVASTPRDMVYYGPNSPEWFSQFCGNSISCAIGESKKTAFAKRDYALARDNVYSFSDKLFAAGKINRYEQMKLQTFFEKFWQIFAGENSSPKVATIKRTAILSPVTKDQFMKTWEEDGRSTQENLKGVHYVLTHDFDSQIAHDIPPENLKIINLPFSPPPQPAEKTTESLANHPSSFSAISREQIDELTKAEDFTPEKLFAELEKDPLLKEQFASPAHISEDLTIKAHSQMVMQQFEKYFKKRQLPAGTSTPLFRVILALHDIGKHLAYEKDFSVNNQHKYTLGIVTPLLKSLNFSKEEIQIAEGILLSDPIGGFLRNKLTAAQAVQKIHEMANHANIDAENFYELLIVFYQAAASGYTLDAGSVESLDHLFSFQPEKGEMSFSPETANRLENIRGLLYQKSPSALELISKCQKNKPLNPHSSIQKMLTAEDIEQIKNLLNEEFNNAAKDIADGKVSFSPQIFLHNLGNFNQFFPEQNTAPFPEAIWNHLLEKLNHAAKGNLASYLHYSYYKPYSRDFPQLYQFFPLAAQLKKLNPERFNQDFPIDPKQLDKTIDQLTKLKNENLFAYVERSAFAVDVVGEAIKERLPKLTRQEWKSIHGEANRRTVLTRDWAFAAQAMKIKPAEFPGISHSEGNIQEILQMTLADGTYSEFLETASDFENLTILPNR